MVQEPNFHVLYLELMEKMNKPMMDKHLATTTYKYIKILLRSDRIKTHVSPTSYLTSASSFGRPAEHSTNDSCMTCI